VQKADLLDLFEYTGFAWDQFREAVPDDAQLARVAPGSGWPALRNCLGHMVLAYERWVPAIIELKTGPLPELADGDFVTWAQIQAHRERVRSRLRNALESWSDRELAVVHEVNVDGDAVRYSRAELVLHLLLHERGHHGDVTTLFWQLGIGADTSLEYRFHLRRGT
jgi:uncharacterized damage-inducible protein DinB